MSVILRVDITETFDRLLMAIFGMMMIRMLQVRVLDVRTIDCFC